MDTINVKREIRTAFKNGDNERIRELIGNDNEILNMTTAFGTWLHVAADFGNIEMVKYLLKLGININIEGETSECAAMKTAASAGNIEVVKYLLDKGAKIDISVAYKNPIFGAIYGGHKDIVELLVESGLDISIKYNGDNIKNMNAYEYARAFGQTEIANYLKEKLEQ